MSGGQWKWNCAILEPAIRIYRAAICGYHFGPFSDRLLARQLQSYHGIPEAAGLSLHLVHFYLNRFSRFSHSSLHHYQVGSQRDSHTRQSECWPPQWGRQFGQNGATGPTLIKTFSGCQALYLLSIIHIWKSGQQRRPHISDPFHSIPFDSCRFWLGYTISKLWGESLVGSLCCWSILYF